MAESGRTVIRTRRRAGGADGGRGGPAHRAADAPRQGAPRVQRRRRRALECAHGRAHGGGGQDVALGGRGERARGGDRVLLHLQRAYHHSLAVVVPARW